MLMLRSLTSSFSYVASSDQTSFLTEAVDFPGAQNVILKWPKSSIFDRKRPNCPVCLRARPKVFHLFSFQLTKSGYGRDFQAENATIRNSNPQRPGAPHHNSNFLGKSWQQLVIFGKLVLSCINSFLRIKLRVLFPHALLRNLATWIPRHRKC
jgi:hypothetical protein